MAQQPHSLRWVVVASWVQCCQQGLCCCWIGPVAAPFPPLLL